MAAAVSDFGASCDKEVFEQDVLLCEEVNQPVAVLAHFAGDAVRELRRVRAFGLRHIEHVHGAEADRQRLRLGFRFRLGGCVFPVAAVAGYGSENLDALLAPLHETAHFITILFDGMLAVPIVTWACGSPNRMKTRNPVALERR